MNSEPSIKTDSPRRRPATTWTKADPYASRIHRRIDLILLAATIIILFLVLRASAHGSRSDNNARLQIVQSSPPNKSGAPQTQQAVQK